MSRLDQLRARRGNADINLSFLDIMACGLGAVILIFLIIKHNIDGGSVESSILMSELETLEQESERLRIEVENTARLNAEQERLGSELEQRQQSSATVLAAVDERLTDAQRKSQQLQSSNLKIEAENQSARIENTGAGEENYVIGMRVEGRRIAILYDHSASMADEKLLDVIRYKIGSAAERKAAPKWRRARRTLDWLLNRVPTSSELVVIGFSEAAQTLGPSSWFKANAPKALDPVVKAAAALAPAGGTNLRAAYDLVATLSPAPTHVYLITDGLPTQTGKGGPRCAGGNSVTASCRVELLREAHRRLKPTDRGMTLNVVLLPLEGDWDAPHQYWSASAQTGGMVISPPASWP